MKKSRLTVCAFGLLALTGCSDLFYPPTPNPDYTILVVPTEQGSLALPPPCPGWENNLSNPFDQQITPQFGCATARNLAAMVENPDDLVQGRALANARGVTSVGAVRRYDNNQTRGLITPDAEVSQVAATTATTAASSMTGDVTGGTPSTSASSGSSASAP